MPVECLRDRRSPLRKVLGLNFSEDARLKLSGNDRVASVVCEGPPDGMRGAGMIGCSAPFPGLVDAGYSPNLEDANIARGGFGRDMETSGRNCRILGMRYVSDPGRSRDVGVVVFQNKPRRRATDAKIGVGGVREKGAGTGVE